MAWCPLKQGSLGYDFIDSQCCWTWPFHLLSPSQHLNLAFFMGGVCANVCVCVCVCVCVRVCLCASVSVWVPTRRSPTQSRANPTYREPAVASNATTFFGKKKNLAGFLWGRSLFLDSGGRGRSLGRILTISGAGWEKFENGVQPCGWGASPDIPNPPGLSREVFAVDGRAGLDIPKSSGTVT